MRSGFWPLPPHSWPGCRLPALVLCAGPAVIGLLFPVPFMYSAATAAAPATAGAASDAVAQLARAQFALADTRDALYALRDEYPRRPCRFARIRAAISRHAQARATYVAAATAFHQSPRGQLLQRLRSRSCFTA